MKFWVLFLNIFSFGMSFRGFCWVIVLFVLLFCIFTSCLLWRMCWWMLFWPPLGHAICYQRVGRYFWPCLFVREFHCCAGRREVRFGVLALGGFFLPLFFCLSWESRLMPWCGGWKFPRRWILLYGSFSMVGWIPWTGFQGKCLIWWGGGVVFL